jgi:hypothetical protein
MPTAYCPLPTAFHLNIHKQTKELKGLSGNEKAFSNTIAADIAMCICVQSILCTRETTGQNESKACGAGKGLQL